MKLASILALLLAGPLAVGQTSKTMNPQLLQQAVNDMAASNINNVSRTFDYRSIDTKGSPFYFPAWLPGEVTISNSKTPYKGEFKLDVMNDRLMMKQPAGDSVWLPMNRFATITLNPLVNDPAGASFRRFPAAKADDARLNTVFVRVLHEGKYGTLVKLPVKQFYKATPTDAYSMNATTNEIRDESVYYVIHPDGQTTTKIAKMNRRTLIEAMGDEGKRLDNSLKANNLPLKTEQNLVAALLTLK